MYSFYEFFAGGGMVRAGLASEWRCLFANDFDRKKSRIYEANWGDDGVFKTADVKTLTTADLPAQADLIWASFPCQDLSLAGGGAGLNGDRSGTFWPFWELVNDIAAEGRAPEVIVLENVCGTLTSHGGKDFATICEAFDDADYRCGAVVMDAALFVPHSRQRLFVIAAKRTEEELAPLCSEGPTPTWHTRSLTRAYERLPLAAKSNWIWWSLPEPEARTTKFAELIEDQPTSVEWHSERQRIPFLVGGGFGAFWKRSPSSASTAKLPRKSSADSSFRSFGSRNRPRRESPHRVSVYQPLSRYLPDEIAHSH